jgi:hypothetical protein
MYHAALQAQRQIYSVAECNADATEIKKITILLGFMAI